MRSPWNSHVWNLHAQRTKCTLGNISLYRLVLYQSDMFFTSVNLDKYRKLFSIDWRCDNKSRFFSLYIVIRLFIIYFICYRVYYSSPNFSRYLTPVLWALLPHLVTSTHFLQHYFLVFIFPPNKIALPPTLSHSSLVAEWGLSSCNWKGT